MPEPPRAHCINMRCFGWNNYAKRISKNFGGDFYNHSHRSRVSNDCERIDVQPERESNCCSVWTGGGRAGDCVNVGRCAQTKCVNQSPTRTTL